MPIKATITEDMKTAMRAKEVARLGTIRMLLAAIKQREVDERIELTDADIIAIINKMIKQRRESITQFRAAERVELAEKEEQEIVWLTHYLPAQLSDSDIDKLIQEAITTTAAKTIKEMGAVMAIIRSKAQGRVDMAEVSEKIKKKLK